MRVDRSICLQGLQSGRIGFLWAKKIFPVLVGEWARGMGKGFYKGEDLSVRRNSKFMASFWESPTSPKEKWGIFLPLNASVSERLPEDFPMGGTFHASG